MMLYTILRTIVSQDDKINTNSSQMNDQGTNSNKNEHSNIWFLKFTGCLDKISIQAFFFIQEILYFNTFVESLEFEG